ncbi:MAG: phosphoribosylformylglycinamidine synthase subunit PurS [Elusimicrobia bacterium]|nr:phosphoribosylformylglycinamidine synthase subunit PurS [Elusimicrobiota bacterium]
MSTENPAAGNVSAAAADGYLVSVCLKPDFTDADGNSALGLLQSAGVAAARSVRVTRLYALDGALNLSHAQLAARELLCDCVTQEFRVGPAPEPAPSGGLLWRVEVWLKPTVTDAVGESLRGALAELGVPEPIRVRCGAAYHVHAKCGRPQIEKAVTRSLANPIIHRFSVSEGR